MVTRRYRFERLEEALDAGRLSQRAFAAQVGVSVSHLSEVLSGRKVPSLTLALRMSKVASVPPDTFHRRG